MSAMSFASVLLLLLGCLAGSHAEAPCETKMLVDIEQRLEHFDSTAAVDFIGLFAHECRRNAEFSEYRNQLLFEIMRTKASPFMKAVALADTAVLENLLIEVETPVSDMVDLRATYCAIKSSGVKFRVNLVLDRLERAMAKLGQAPDQECVGAIER